MPDFLIDLLVFVLAMWCGHYQASRRKTQVTAGLFDVSASLDSARVDKTIGW